MKFVKKTMIFGILDQGFYKARQSFMKPYNEGVAKYSSHFRKNESAQAQKSQAVVIA